MNLKSVCFKVNLGHGTSPCFKSKSKDGMYLNTGQIKTQLTHYRGQHPSNYCKLVQSLVQTMRQGKDEPAQDNLSRFRYSSWKHTQS